MDNDKLTSYITVSPRLPLIIGQRAELPYKKGNRRVLKRETLPYNTGNRKQKRLPVTKQSKREYIKEMQLRYRSGSRQEQTSMLDEMVRVTKFNRKYLIRVLNKKPPPQYPKALYGGSSEKKKAGRPTIYADSEIIAFLQYLWHATGQACAKRLKSIIPLWLPWYEPATGKKLSLVQQVLILQMAHTTIDRLLADERRPYRIGKGRATTKPGTLMKKRIAIKTDQWKEQRPGFLEVDTVAHCGTSTAGQFVYSLNTVDISSGWVAARAVWGKGERAILEAFRSIEETLPFRLRGFDSDNGSEFINHHIESYLRGRKRSVEHTRSREYKKNDNAHIEQKNWTHIRQTFGYERFDNPDVVAPMNDVYAQEFSLLMNFFLPSVKLQKKERIGSTIIKRHDQPQTPCQRLLRSRLILEQTKECLRQTQQTLNPFLLHQAIQRTVKLVLRRCSLHPGTQQPRTTVAKQLKMHSRNNLKLSQHHEVTPLALRARSVTS
jgi:hypothetical protein